MDVRTSPLSGLTHLYHTCGVGNKCIIKCACTLQIDQSQASDPLVRGAEEELQLHESTREDADRDQDEEPEQSPENLATDELGLPGHPDCAPVDLLMWPTPA